MILDFIQNHEILFLFGFSAFVVVFPRILNEICDYVLKKK